MMARVAQPGRVTWIGGRSGRREEVVAVERVLVKPGGLQGDHARKGKRAVTLVQAEHLLAIGSFLGAGPVAPEVLRRNLVVEGINLLGLKEREVRIGGALLRLTVPCHPCSRMEEALGPGGYAAMRGHGGWCAEVLEPGEVALGDRVEPV
ncbi:MOSC domain-containing protein [Pseudoroseicyclus sp. CLL3-39]|uniref:MOSC domain-containing protein n=2 Tax=Pseudoroseicyclus tamaricis TaxID=2705421 RepID=A0A6B2K1X2_9RHOB|nr:MOSC domain-containing protein [Pseudoroseicyclus tamaricis]